MSEQDEPAQPAPDEAEEVPPVVRHLSADQTVGHEELQRATFARAVKTPEKP